jgi:hypothetical protein
MAESPDRRLIEPGANLVNERLPRELLGLAHGKPRAVACRNSPPRPVRLTSAWTTGSGLASAIQRVRSGGGTSGTGNALVATRHSPRVRAHLRLPAGPGPPQRKGQFDVLGLLLEMSLDRTTHDLGERSQWLPFVELRISDGDGQQTPIGPVEANGRFDPVALSRSASTALAYFHPSTNVLITPQAARPSARATNEANRNVASLVMSATLGVGRRSIAKRRWLMPFATQRGGVCKSMGQAQRPPRPTLSPPVGRGS